MNKKVAALGVLLGTFSLAQAQDRPFTVISDTRWTNRNLNPFTPVDVHLPPTTSLIYETLLYINILNNKVTPVLASSYAWSGNNTVLTFTPRAGVKWSDGTPFTATDIAFTFNLIRSNPGADLEGVWKTGLSSVTVDKQNNVVFKFARANTPALVNIARVPIVSQRQWKDVKDATKFANPDAIGTGPYVLTDYTAEALRLKKNPNYWMPGKPAISTAVWISNNNNDTAFLKMLKGDGDFASIYSADIKQYTSRGPNYQVFTPITNVTTLMFNNAKAPFSDPKFRRAVAQGLNPRDMALKVRNDAEAAANPSGVNPNQDEWLSPTAKKLFYSYNPQAADAALVKAGYKKDSQGRRLDREGKPLPTFKILVGAGWTDYITIAQVAQNNLAALGIKAELDQQAFGAWWGSLQSGTYDLALMAMSPTPSPTPYLPFQSAFNSVNTAPVGKPAVSNFSRYKSATMDAALAAFRASSDPASQKKALGNVITNYLENVPSVPLVWGYAANLFNTTNFTGFPSAADPYNEGNDDRSPSFRMMLLNLKPR